MSWVLRARGPGGQATVTGLDATTTVSALKDLIAERVGVPAARQELLGGFPPKPLQLEDGAATISSVGIANGDSLTVREGAASGAASAAAPAAPAPAAAAPAPPAAAAPAPAPVPAATTRPQPLAAVDDISRGFHAINGDHGMDEDAALAAALAASLEDAAPPQPPQQQQQRPPPAGAAPTSVPLPGGSGSGGGAVVRRIIDSDNSCLFNAVGYVMERSRSKARELRAVIARAVAADPDTYNEAFLGQPNAEYCKWILDPKHWGGAIELSILSGHYAREIAAYDIQTGRCDVYGTGSGYNERAMLLYDGLHYDAMAVAAYDGAPEQLDVTLLPTGSARAAAAAAGAAALVAQLTAARQFTDTTNFALRCGVCQVGLKGEKEAAEHAKATGHTRFSEY